MKLMTAPVEAKVLDSALGWGTVRKPPVIEVLVGVTDVALPQVVNSC